MLSPTPAQSSPETFEPGWKLVTAKAAWQPRDSMGYVAFRNRLWILGGWFDSGSPCPRDVWSSADGCHWELELREAPWRHSDFPICLVFRDRMWVMGGWYNGRLPYCEAGNEVWSTGNGYDWSRTPDKAAWSPRVGAAGIIFRNKMWIFGGVEKYFAGDESHLKNDVWYSENGETWDLVTHTAAWSPRAFHQSVVFDDKLWILGGGNYLPNYKAFNDVWCSEDGVNWHQVTGEAPWSERLWFAAVAYRDRLWIMGGWSNDPFQDYNDVWHSKDGVTWTRLESETVWSKRHAQAAYVFDDKLWIAGGHARPLSNEVWRLE